MTRPLCKSSNFARPAVDAGLLRKNISNHIARSRNEKEESRPPSPVSSIIEQSFSGSISEIPCSKGTNDGPLPARTRSISFSDKVGIRFTTSLKEMTPQEFNALWYSAEEYEKITQACSKQVERLDRGETLKDKKFCSRGLECHTRIRSLTKRMNRTMAYQVVLQEQNNQAMGGVIHDDAIARVYHDVSSSCQLWAHAVALADQREIEGIQDG